MTPDEAELLADQVFTALQTYFDKRISDLIGAHPKTVLSRQAELQRAVAKLETQVALLDTGNGGDIARAVASLKHQASRHAEHLRALEDRVKKLRQEA